VFQWQLLKDGIEGIILDSYKGQPEQILGLMKDSSVIIRELAANALEKIDWNPENDEDYAYYLVGKRKYIGAALIGELAKPALKSALEGNWSGFHDKFDKEYLKNEIKEALEKIQKNTINKKSPEKLPELNNKRKKELFEEKENLPILSVFNFALTDAFNALVLGVVTLIILTFWKGFGALKNSWGICIIGIFFVGLSLGCGSYARRSYKNRFLAYILGAIFLPIGVWLVSWVTTGNIPIPGDTVSPKTFLMTGAISSGFGLLFAYIRGKGIINWPTK
jgi:hypothetical protein